jgi:Rad3-related DNA helicase
MGILDHCTKPPRPLQKEVLLQVESQIDAFDVFVLALPTGVGKSMISTTLARWLHKEKGIGSSITVPTNLLRDQYLEDNPRMHTLSRADLYTCSNWDDETSCKVVKGKQKHYCKGCPYMAAKKRSYGVPYGLYNSHIYLANQIYKPGLIADEAHTLLSLLADRASDRIWQHDYFYPKHLSTYAELVNWLRMRESTVGLDEKLTSLLAELTSDKPRYVVEAGEDLFRGEMRNCLKLLPVDLRDMPPILWPKNKVRKIFLLSATIAQPDIVQMGLDKKRVCYIGAPSPVEAERRPIVYLPQGALTKGTAPLVLPAIVDAIRVLADYHEGERGLIHCTYEISRYLYAHLGEMSGRIMYHTPETRTETVAAFKNSPIHEGRILVGCGLEEGLDLPGDHGRWQVIAKVPWPSLDEPAIRWMSQEQPELYIWQTVKKVLQASGRIVRGVDDRGTTYILDSTFERLYTEGLQWFPQWWRDALYEDTIEEAQ